MRTVYTKTTNHKRAPGAKFVDTVVRKMTKKPSPVRITKTTVTSTLPFKGATKKMIVEKPKKKKVGIVKGAKAWYPTREPSTGIGVGP